jgi:putative ABC transport system ATP-binding protein
MVDGPSMLVASDLCHTYLPDRGQGQALSHVDLVLARGEFLALCGPSGSGKSTLLLALGGMLTPTSGRVQFDGRDLYALSDGERRWIRRMRVGFAFQSMHLIPYLSAQANVALGDARAGAEARAEERLDGLGLATRLDHLPEQLSSGERQRVALARAMASDPEVLLADEPTGNLDPESAELVYQQLTAYHRSGGTLLLVTHDAKLAQAAPKVQRIEAGRLLSGGAPDPQPSSVKSS